MFQNLHFAFMYNIGSCYQKGRSDISINLHFNLIWMHAKYNRKYLIMYFWYLTAGCYFNDLLTNSLKLEVIILTLAELKQKLWHSFFLAFSSDSSMCSDLDLEKCDLEVITSFDLKDDSDSKSATSAGDTVDWSRCKDQLVLDLQVSNYARISSIVTHEQ